MSYRNWKSKFDQHNQLILKQKFLKWFLRNKKYNRLSKLREIIIENDIFKLYFADFYLNEIIELCSKYVNK